MENPVKKHFTSTTYIYDLNITKTLLLWHKKLATWLPPGGHLDVNETPEEAALREIQEEIGLIDFEFVNTKSEEHLDERASILLQPYYMLLEKIEEAHFHMDFIFFARMKNSAELESPEAHTLKWFTKQEIQAEGELFENVRCTAFNGFQIVKKYFQLLQTPYSS